MEQSLRRDLTWGFLAGSSIGLASLRPASALVIPILGLGLLAWWTLCEANRWIVAFLLAALLLPPLPLPGGDAGPHPAIAVAGLGLLAGLARLPLWRFRLDLLSASLLMFFGALLFSVPLAALYSGLSIASGSLARVGLLGIAVYAFFYLSLGPGRDFPADRLIRLLFWTGLCAAAFACLDFYFQFPAPARFADQFVWLPNGVFRRAQGFFYEASTLGSFCVFLLVMIASIAALRLGGPLGLSASRLLAATIILLTALMFSFSRAAVVSLVVALGMLAWLERHRLKGALKAMALVAASVACGGAFVYWLFPELLAFYVERLRTSSEFLLSDPNMILSRRLESWQFLLDALWENPWRVVFGVGYKTLPYSDVLGQPLVVDNMYLSLLVETGWLGLAAVIALNVAILITSFRQATHAGSAMRRLLGVWMFCFWCGQAVQMASGDTLTYWRILPAFFAVLALVHRDENPVP